MADDSRRPRASRKRKARGKPRWPYPHITRLTAHPSGYWVKKIGGTLYYFGRWEEPEEAVRRYQQRAAALHEGRPAPTDHQVDKDRGAEVGEVVNAWLAACEAQVEAGEMRPSTWRSYHRAAGDLIEGLGRRREVATLGPDDFARFRATLAKRLGPHALGRYVTITRMVFSWAWNNEWIEQPVRYGSGFKKPDQVARRRARRGKAVTFDRAACLRLLAGANLDTPRHPLEAMILLALNGGFGQADCAQLPQSAVDLDRGVIDYARPKTEVERQVVLWPETRDAMAAYAERRGSPRDADADGLFFRTKYGRAWVRSVPTREGGRYARVGEVDAVSRQFSRLKRDLEIEGPGFYGLRHTFRTIADEAGDQHAVHRIMGHALPGMSDVYVERVTRERIEKVTEHVRSWLFRL